MFCKFKQNGDRYQCNCGKQLPLAIDIDRVKSNCRETGLGDKLEAILKRFGITQELYKRAKALVGLSSKCNCKARKELLNTAQTSFGRWLRD